MSGTNHSAAADNERSQALSFLVEGATAPRQEQVVVGGVGRWGRMTGTHGRLIARRSWLILLRKGWEETADGVGRGWVRLDSLNLYKALVG